MYFATLRDFGEESFANDSAFYFLLCAAICKLPKTSGDRSSDKKLLPITVVCDNIQDPGMLGTLLRSAVAARCSKILVTRGTNFA